MCRGRAADQSRSTETQSSPLAAGERQEYSKKKSDKNPLTGLAASSLEKRSITTQAFWIGHIILKQDKIRYTDIDENSEKGKEYIEAIKEESLEKLGYFLKPSELFSEVAKFLNDTGIFPIHGTIFHADF